MLRQRRSWLGCRSGLASSNRLTYAVRNLSLQLTMAGDRGWSSEGHPRLHSRCTPRPSVNNDWFSAPIGPGPSDASMESVQIAPHTPGLVLIGRHFSVRHAGRQGCSCFVLNDFRCWRIICISPFGKRIRFESGAYRNVGSPLNPTIGTQEQWTSPGARTRNAPDVLIRNSVERN